MDTEPDEILIMPEGAVQRWDRPDGITFRLDIWGACPYTGESVQNGPYANLREDVRSDDEADEDTEQTIPRSL